MENIDYLIQTEKYQEALNLLLDKEVFSGQNFGNSLRIAKIYYLLENFKEAIIYIKICLNIEPLSLDANLTASRIYFALQEYHNAELCLNKIQPEVVNSPIIYNDLGVIYFKLNNLKLSMKYLQMSLQIDSSYLEAVVNYIKLLIEIKDFNQAKNLLNKYLPQNKDNYILLELKTIVDFSLKEQDRLIKLELSDSKIFIEPIKILENYQGKDKKYTKPQISIVIPIYNEEENIKHLYLKIITELKKIKQKSEIIFIDDGSKDKSLQVLKSISDPMLRIIEFRKNYGQTAALSAGFKYAQGNVIITMDGDLQNDPADIPRLLKKMSEGYDLVSGWRKDRQDKAFTRVIPSKIANFLINKLIAGTGIVLHDYGCTLKAYKRGIIKNIKLYGEMHRFIPAFAAWLGVKVTEIPVKHHSRQYGMAKYNLSRVSRVIFDLLVVRFFTDYSTRPIQFFGKIAWSFFAYGNLLLLIGGLINFSLSFLPFGYETILILFILLGTFSFQILILGLLGEILMRIYYESQNKDYFIIENIYEK